MRKALITAGMAAALATTGFVGTAAANPLLIPLIAGAVVGGAAVGTAADDYGPAYSDETSSYTYVQPQPSYTYVQPQTSYTYVQPSVTYQRTYTTAYADSHTAWCESHYRSYDPSTDSFISYSGIQMRCVSPYG